MLFSSSIKDMVRVWKVLCYLGLKNQTKPHLTQGKQAKCGIPAFVAEGIGRRGLPQWLPRVLKMVMSSTNHTETGVFFADWMKNHQMPRRVNPRVQEASCQGPHFVILGVRARPPPSVQRVIYRRNIRRHDCHKCQNQTGHAHVTSACCGRYFPGSLCPEDASAQRFWETA